MRPIVFTALKYLREQIGKDLTSADDIPVIRQFFNQLNMYLLTANSIFATDNEEGGKSIMEKRNYYIHDFPMKLNAFLDEKNSKGKYKYPEIRNSTIIKRISNISRKGIKFANIGKVSPEARRVYFETLDGMIANEDAKVREIAQDLLMYSFYDNGLNFAHNSFGIFFTTFFLSKIPRYIDALKEANGRLQSDPTFVRRYVEQFLLNNPGVKYTLMALSPAIIFVSMSAVLRGYFIGMQNVSEYSKAQIIEQIINCVFSVIFVFMLIGNSPEIMAAGSTLATTVATSTAFFYLLRYYKKNKAEIWEEINKSERFAKESRKSIAKKLLSYAIPISFGSVVSTLAGLIDVITVVNGLQQKGYDIITANAKYGILSGKVDILLAIPLSINVAFSVALVPFISYAIAKHRKDEAIEKINYSLKISSLIALPCTFGLFVLAQPIFNMLFRNAPEGAYLLQIECWLLFFSVLSQTLTGALQGIGKLIVPGLALLVGTAIKYVLNVIFIPIYGEVVPAITSIIFSATAFFISAVVLFRTLKMHMNVKDIVLKPLLASAIMGGVVFLGYKLGMFIHLGNMISTVLAIGIGVIAYVILVLMMRILNKKEIQQLPYGNKICKMLKI